MPERNMTAWKEEEIALLGTMPDTDISKRIGRGLNQVRNKRKLLGIAKFRKTDCFTFTSAMDAQLGIVSDAEFAEWWNVPKYIVHQRRNDLGISPYRFFFDWTDEHIRRLGKELDCHLATEWELHYSTVAHKRRQLGIPSLYKTKRQLR